MDYHPDNSSRGFVKIQRSEVTDFLLRDPNALHLLFVIALRARWADGVSLDGLRYGQALVGDYEDYGMSRKAYRCAMDRLKKWGLASFKGKSRGTVATLLDSRVFSLRDERDTSKKGRPKGQPQGQHFPEVNSECGAIKGASFEASEGPAKGQLGATNQKGRRIESKYTTAPAGLGAEERDLLFQAIARAEGSDPTKLTKSAARTVAVALAEIRQASPEVTPEEIERRARNYQSQMPAGSVLTAPALAKHWARCATPRQIPASNQRPEPKIEWV